MVTIFIRYQIIKYNTHTTCYFTGAKRPLLVFKDGYSELENIKGTRKSIGGTQKKLNQEEFCEQEILFHNSGYIYLSSDGYTDQNNIERKKFGSVQLNNVVMNNIGKSIQEQGEILNDAILNWMSDSEQRDDITFVGIRIEV